MKKKHCPGVVVVTAQWKVPSRLSCYESVNYTPEENKNVYWIYTFWNQNIYIYIITMDLPPNIA